MLHQKNSCGLKLLPIMALSLRSASRLSSKVNLARKSACIALKVLPRCMSSLPDIMSDNLKFTKRSTLKDKPTDVSNIEFGTVFTDHMLTVRWSSRGWENPEIKPYGDITLSPAAKVFHYAVEGFEGMKAYFNSSDGSIRLFRPMDNMRRLQRTAERLRLPPTLGVSEGNEALLYCILSPVGPYFKTGSFKPVSLMADARFVRSWHGGSGDSKAGGNYAPTLFAQAEAVKKNCEQVLWLFGDDEQITEVGTMNLFIFLENENGEKELVTPPLDGLILPGVTRMAMLDLAQQWDEFKVSERRYTMNDLRKALKEERVKEVFGAGTACVICPVKDILYKNEVLHIPTMENGPKIAKKFYDELTGIQYGRIPSPWSVLVTN
ncbi:branched-chain-amino-acid aminotransferase, cytosolic-like isoform X2 [Dendronephthya gigantea]|uniref:branched-chain-amino-acid aminotransferase, cytosolic-like isoform X2 n=1 Tax=Dendronephthya gigantea TaxID=151771 RepID=UPI00106A8B29|nr:branched-chain-amino-acid aminotransferase, cytosolic-like isoform X2 [Dendronephthya gigantea]